MSNPELHGKNYGEPPVITQKQVFLSRLAGENHETAIEKAESHEEITWLLNHANSMKPQFSGTLRRRLIRAAAQRRQWLREQDVLSQQKDKTGGLLPEGQTNLGV